MIDRRLISASLKGLLLIAAVAGLYFWFVRSDVSNAPAEEAVKTEVAVRTDLIQQTTLHRYLTVYGRVISAPATVGKPAAGAAISVTQPSLVADVICREGDHVEKGRPLLVLDSREADAAVERARKAVSASQAVVDAYNNQTDKSSTPIWYPLQAESNRELAQIDLDIAIARQAQLKILAPVSGTVVSVLIRPGEIARPDTIAIEIDDLDRLVIEANVPSAEISGVKVGQPAEIFPESTAETQPTTMPSISGAVTIIDHYIDPATDMASIDVSIPPGSQLRIGQFVQLRIVTEERRDVLAVPVESVVTNADGQTVVNLVYSDVAFPEKVTVGLREGGLVEISGENVRAQQTVVTTGAYGIIAKTRLRVIEQ